MRSEEQSTSGELASNGSVCFDANCKSLACFAKKPILRLNIFYIMVAQTAFSYIVYIQYLISGGHLLQAS